MLNLLSTTYKSLLDCFNLIEVFPSRLVFSLSKYIIILNNTLLTSANSTLLSVLHCTDCVSGMDHSRN